MMQPGEVKRELVTYESEGLRRWSEVRMLPGDPPPTEPTDRWLRNKLDMRWTRPITEGETFESAAARSFAFSPAADTYRDYRTHSSWVVRFKPPRRLSRYEYTYPDGSERVLEYCYVCQD